MIYAKTTSFQSWFLPQCDEWIMDFDGHEIPYHPGHHLVAQFFRIFPSWEQSESLQLRVVNKLNKKGIKELVVFVCCDSMNKTLINPQSNPV